VRLIGLLSVMMLAGCGSKPVLSQYSLDALEDMRTNPFSRYIIVRSSGAYAIYWNGGKSQFVFKKAK
jgi:hypothetical protein